MAKKKEFTDDPMMHKLHEIRSEIHQSIKDLNPKEKVAWIHKEAEGFLKSQGYKLTPARKGYRIAAKSIKG